MEILVIGGSGQLGNCIKDFIEKDKSLTEENNFYFPSHKELDITNRDNIKDYIKSNNINYVINCSAFTDVKGSEKEGWDNAISINYYGVDNLAKVCREEKAFLLHISTDYVFEGRKDKPYKESDDTIPLNEYGRSKLFGENAIRETENLKYIIIRTSWLYSQYGKNFVKTIFNKIKNNDDLKVIFDQIGSPTNANDLAQFILYNILPNQEKSGLYQFSNLDIASWYSFACEIKKCMEKYGISSSSNIVAIKTPENDSVRRPSYSVMSKDKIIKDFIDENKENKNKFYIFEIPFWKDSLNNFIKNNINIL